jgi:transposase
MGTGSGPIYGSSIRAVKRYVHRLRRSDPQLVQRIEVEPGEEVQVDFGTGPTLRQSEGKKRKTWIFRLVLSYSRKAFSQAVLRQDTETFLRCIEADCQASRNRLIQNGLGNMQAHYALSSTFCKV